jgi:hypothetical protein
MAAATVKSHVGAGGAFAIDLIADDAASIVSRPSPMFAIAPATGDTRDAVCSQPRKPAVVSNFIARDRSRSCVRHIRESAVPFYDNPTRSRLLAGD